MTLQEYTEKRREKDLHDYKFYLESFLLIVLFLVFLGIGIGLLGMILAVFA